MASVIRTLADLYEHFGSDPSFRSLNRRIYKDTKCGASISIYGTLPVEEAPADARAAAERAGMASALRREYDRVLPDVERVYATLDEAKKLDVQKLDGDFQAGQPDGLIAWIRSVVPNAFPDDVVSPTPATRVPVAFHNGDQNEIPDSFVLEYFTIQTIVEGSDVEVNSDPFLTDGSTTGEIISEWVADMEASADDLWREANRDDDADEDDDVPGDFIVVTSSSETPCASLRSAVRVKLDQTEGVPYIRHADGTPLSGEETDAADRLAASLRSDDDADVQWCHDDDTDDDADADDDTDEDAE